MTVTEFKNEFNILYDSIASNSAPGLDDYEISVFLTRAQEELVKNKALVLSDPKRQGFEGDSKRRNDLKNLIKDYKTSTVQTLDRKINDTGTFFIVPSDVMLILQEAVKITNTDCANEIQTVSVVPKTHDEYNIQINNPFKNPSSSEVWRIDYNSLDAANNVVEIISEYPITEYRMRYLKYPQPIIISDLTAFNESLSINGLTSARSSELDDSVHIEITKRAVEMAILSYRENNLRNNIEFNQRVE